MIFGCIQVSNAMEIKGHIDGIDGENIGIRYDGDFSGSIGDMAKVTFIQIDGSERVIGKWKIVSGQGRLSTAKPIEVFEKPGIGQNVVVYGSGETIEPSLPVVQPSGKEPKPIKPELDPNKPNSINPNHPKVATLIKEWISSAEPPMNATDGANARYEHYGRWVGEGINGIIGKVTANPDDVAGRTPEKYVWDKRDKLDSVDHCTLGEYVIAKLKNSSIDHCKGRYKLKKGKQRNKQVEELIKKSRGLWERGKLDEAIKTAKKASEIVPKDTKIAKIHTAMQKQKKIIDKKLNTVSSNIKNNKLKEAEAELARASRISTEYPGYKKAKKELEDAKTKAKEERKRNKQADELLKKARELWRKGDLSKAIETMKKASRIVPNDAKVAKTAAAMKRQKKIMDNALSECGNFIGQGEFKKAERTLKKAERISNNYPPYVKMLDKLRNVKEKFDRIKNIIEEAKQQWIRKQSPSAITKLDKVLTIDPRHKEAANLKKEWEKILRDHEKTSKPNWDNGCYNGENIGGATLQWTLRDPPPYSGLTPICSDRDGKLWILNNHISQIIKGKLNRYGCYSGSTVKTKNRDYRGTLCRPKGYNENTEDKPKRPDRPNQVNGTLWDVWGPIPYGYGKKCFTQAEVVVHMRPEAKKDKDGWYARKNGGSMKPTGKSCTKSGSSVDPSSGHVVVTDVVGLGKKQAEKKLKEIGLKTKIALGDQAPSKKNGLKVQKSIPSMGTSLKRGSTVTLVVHPPFVDRRTVPSLTGDTESEVIKKIKNAGLIPRVRKVKASSASQSGKMSSVKPSSGTEILAGSTVFVDVFDTYDGGSESDPWVDKVVSFIHPPGSSDEGYEADIALGPPTTAKFVAIDKPEIIIFAFTDNVVVDGEGNDLKLHEYVNGDSPVEVFVSADNTRYISLGKTAKSAEYDLANYNLSTVRYVKLVGLGDGGAAKGYDLMAIEALNSSPDRTIIFVDDVEDFGSKSSKKEAKCAKYNECLTEMIQEIQQLSLNMASGQSMSFGCKYLGLGQAFAKVAQDANSDGCTIEGNYAHTGDMIKATAEQMCAGLSIAFDVNTILGCRGIGKKVSSSHEMQKKYHTNSYHLIDIQTNRSGGTEFTYSVDHINKKGGAIKFNLNLSQGKFSSDIKWDFLKDIQTLNKGEVIPFKIEHAFYDLRENNKWRDELVKFDFSISWSNEKFLPKVIEKQQLWQHPDTTSQEGGLYLTFSRLKNGIDNHFVELKKSFINNSERNQIAIEVKFKITKSPYSINFKLPKTEFVVLYVFERDDSFNSSHIKNKKGNL